MKMDGAVRGLVLRVLGRKAHSQLIWRSWDLKHIPRWFMNAIHCWQV